MLVFLSTVAMAASIKFADEAALQGCRSVTGINTLDGVQQCCNSCSDNYLLWTAWLLKENHTHDQHAVAESEVETMQGSAFVGQETSINEALQTTDVITSTMKPCGVCVKAKECISQGWVVNTWHRLCQSPKNV
ncbi:MAG: hypothetical protein CL678_01285 [Bdellovibrionaceae bacterium]|nr:hypothetical protein [Pseudobdellovibrionaceae bacterium]|tara:strand:- start:594 stop:995 length:402 start_codon:yes stop_codon:yes gene_type:complete